MAKKKGKTAVKLYRAETGLTNDVTGVIFSAGDMVPADAFSKSAIAYWLETGRLTDPDATDDSTGDN